MNNNDLHVRQSLPAMLRDAASQVIELEAELEREAARRAHLEQIVKTTTLAFAANGSLTLKEYVELQGYTASGHA
jgi:hypothetical protein